MLAYLVSLFAPRSVYTLGVWCFTGFSGLFPLVFASLYWKRVTAAGAIGSIVAALAVLGLPVPRLGLGMNKDYLFRAMLPAATIVFTATVAPDCRLAGDLAAAKGRGRAILPEGNVSYFPTFKQASSFSFRRNNRPPESVGTVQVRSSQNWNWASSL